MNLFTDTLHNRIERVQEAIADARDAGDAYSAEVYTARLTDLLDLAARNGVDTTTWVDPALLARSREA
jgi:hypothetical protein